MKNLVVDFGNTTAKVGIFNQHELQEEYVFATRQEAQTFIKDSSAQACIISSVRGDVEKLREGIPTVAHYFVLTHQLPLPILNKYATPETLGMDRVAAVCGARVLFPHEPCLVIDSGTCITYDFINKKNEYLGGAIAPGLQMRLRAMHEFTARLPLIEIEENIPLVGDSTKTCMQSGALNGMLAEIEGMIARYQEDYPELRVILCGGDTHFFENNLKGSIFAVQNLVLQGLNSILLHNVSQ